MNIGTVFENDFTLINLSNVYYCLLIKLRINNIMIL